jgi:hypothetical protein
VPQWSLLGPLLFTMYINDLPSVISTDTSVHLFADDAKCARTIIKPTDCHSLQNDLDDLHSWSCDWKLQFNSEKCEVMSITRKKSPVLHCYTLDGHALKRSQEQKDLGVTISSDLKWTSHINKSVSKGYRMLGLLKRHTNKGDFDVNTKKALYLTLVRPSLGYANQVWSNTSVGNLKTIESLQRRATRYILPNTELSYKERLLSLNMLPLTYWHEMNNITLFYKLINKHYNVQLNELIQFKNTRTTRHSSKYDIKVPLCKSKLFQNSFYCVLPKIWNSLPVEVRLSSSKSVLKRKLTDYYTEALKNTYDIDYSQTWKTVCPKCSGTNNLSMRPSCC